MTRKKPAVEFPADILAMSLEELKRESEAQFSEENQAKFDALLAARDAAQALVHAHNTRAYQINQRYFQLLTEKKNDRQESTVSHG